MNNELSIEWIVIIKLTIVSIYSNAERDGKPAKGDSDQLQ